MPKYRLSEAGESYREVLAADSREAFGMAYDAFDPDNYSGADSAWLCDISAMGLGDAEGDDAHGTITVQPAEPDCLGRGGHRGESPLSVVGGCWESPGVRGHGGGVLVTEVCSRCGMYRDTDTWAQDGSTGRRLDEAGLAYRPADDASEVWVASLMPPTGPVRGSEDGLPYCATCWMPEEPSEDYPPTQEGIPLEDPTGLFCSSCDKALS